jgi:hypothetical protein
VPGSACATCWWPTIGGGSSRSRSVPTSGRPRGPASGGLQIQQPQATRPAMRCRRRYQARTKAVMPGSLCQPLRRQTPIVKTSLDVSVWSRPVGPTNDRPKARPRTRTRRSLITHLLGAGCFLAALLVPTFFVAVRRPPPRPDTVFLVVLVVLRAAAFLAPAAFTARVEGDCSS